MFDLLIQNNPSLSPVIADVSAVSQYLWQKGWAERNAGNISVRITDIINVSAIADSDYPEFPLPLSYGFLAGEIFLMTGTGRRMRDIQSFPFNNTLLIKINDNGQMYTVISHTAKQLGSLRPTSELSSHLSIHQYLKTEKNSKKVVVHTHPNELIALTHLPVFKEEDSLNRMIWGMHPEAAVFVPEGAGLVPYVLTGSDELGLETLKSLKHHNVVLWEKHGCLAVAESAGEAFDLIDIVSKSADIYLKCKAAGFEPEGLTENQMKELRDSFFL
ncbi:MAG: rhamnulose-1-phosphate aldolase [Bacteroidales bacterium]